MTKVATCLTVASLALAACSSADRPDESGLTAAEKGELVERYYACAREHDARCLRGTLHPVFEATDDPAGTMAASAHAETMIAMLRGSRVETRVLPHEGAEVWVVELWIDRHGGASNRLRSFAFEDRSIRRKSALAG
jgi:hypothetical protein